MVEISLWFQLGFGGAGERFCRRRIGLGSLKRQRLRMFESRICVFLCFLLFSQKKIFLTPENRKRLLDSMSAVYLKKIDSTFVTSEKKDFFSKTLCIRSKVFVLSGVSSKNLKIASRILHFHSKNSHVKKPVFPCRQLEQQ